MFHKSHPKVFFQQKVEDMYRILMGISRELSNIKQIMSEEGEERNERKL